MYHHLQLDLIELELTELCNVYGEVLTGLFSKFAWVKPLPSKHAHLVVSFLEEVVTKHGRFSILQTDNGSEFANQEIKSYLESQQIGNNRS